MIRATVAILAVCHGLLAVQAAPVQSDADLSAICADQPVASLTIDQVKSFADQLKAGNAECPEHIKKALVDLDHLLTVGAKDACSKTNLDLLANFRDTNTGLDWALPRSLRAFVLSYVMQTSHKCKLNMAEFLSGEANELLTADDFQVLAELTKEGGEVDQLLSSVERAEGALLPSDLAAALMHYSTGDKLEVNSDVQDDTHRIKQVCARRFKPVYWPAMKPIVEMSLAGYDYPDQKIREELAIGAEQAKKLAEFNRIVFLCETIELVVDGQAGADDESVKPISFEPKNKVVIDDVPMLSESEVSELLEKVKSHSTHISAIQKDIYEKASAAMERLSPGESDGVKEVATCVRNQKSDEDKQICGAPKSGAHAFVYIFMAAVISFPLMLLSAD